MAFECSSDTTDLYARSDIFKVLTKTGGKVFKVHAYSGRYHATHGIIVTAKGHILFPDHGMCGMGTMVSELLLATRGVSFEKDSCYALAALVYLASTRGKAAYKDAYDRLRIFDIPVRANRRRYADSSNMTSDLRKWWSPQAFEFIAAMNLERHNRYVRGKPVVDPQVIGIPFSQSVKQRVESYIQRFSAETLRKMSVVLMHAKQPQLPFSY